MIVFSFPEGERLMWFGGRLVEATGPDPVRRLLLMADALRAIAVVESDGDDAIRSALEQLPGASVALQDADLRRLPR